MKRFITRCIDTLFLTRPVLLIPVWGFAAFGYWQSSNRELLSIFSFWTATPVIVYFDIFIFSLSVGSVYILNQIADIEVDKKNGGLPLLAAGVTKLSTAWVGAVVLTALSLLVPIISGKAVLAYCSLSAVLLGIVYSFKPVAFSGRPFLDFIANATGYGIIAFAAGWSIGNTERTEFLHFLYRALPYFLLMCAGSISSTLPDRDGDLAEGKNTTAVVLGNRTAHLIATILLFFALIISFLAGDHLAQICTIIPLPIYIAYILIPGVSLMEATYKIGGALTMLCACFILPFILPSGIIVFLLTRLYFRVRHGVGYPSLVPVR